MEKICLFDLNGTLLDLTALDDFFASVFGDAVYRELWFKTVLHTCLVSTVTDDFQAFSKIGEETLVSLAQEKGFEIDGEQKKTFKKQMESLPAFPDAASCLTLLKQAGYRLAVLTNSSRKTVERQLAAAQLQYYFDDVISAESAESYKPSIEPYEYAIDQFEADADHIWMVAGHAWDIAGAEQAGLKTALVAQPGHGVNDCFPGAKISGANLSDIAQKIIDADRSLLEKLF